MIDKDLIARCRVIRPWEVAKVQLKEFGRNLFKFKINATYTDSIVLKGTSWPVATDYIGITRFEADGTETILWHKEGALEDLQRRMRIGKAVSDALRHRAQVEKNAR